MMKLKDQIVFISGSSGDWAHGWPYGLPLKAVR